MTTLIKVRDGSGKVIHRCDSRCHNAIGKKCTCVCGGKNHGIGLESAIENIKKGIIEKEMDLKEGESATVHIPAKQLELISLEELKK